MDVDRRPSFTSVAPPRTGSQASDQLMDMSSNKEHAPSIGSMLGSGGRGNSQPTRSCSSCNWPPSHGDVAPRDNSLSMLGGKADSQLPGGSSSYNWPPSYSDVAPRRDQSGYSGDEIDSADLGSDAPARIPMWTPELHKRFVDAVAHVGGIRKALPKYICLFMGVDGLTREDVLSHLKKYRLYLKRMQGLSSVSAGDPTTDHLFASSPIPADFLHQISDQFMRNVPAELQQQQQLGGHNWVFNKCAI